MDLSDIEEDDVEIQAEGLANNGRETGQSIALYYWGLAHLGIPHHDTVYEKLDALVAKHPESFTLQ